MQTSLSAGRLVYDSTLTSLSGCSKLMDAVLASGRKVVVLFVWRDPVDAFIATMKRANSSDGGGRVVQLSTHLATHRNAVATVLALHEQYAGEPDVAFTYVHNTGKDGVARPTTIGLVRNADYTGIDEVLRFALEAAHSTQTPSIAAFAALTFEEQVEQIKAGAIADLKKYGGNPELLIKDMPHRDYSRFEKKSSA